LGIFKVPIHLTMDLVPEMTVIVHREGEVPSLEKTVEEPEEAPIPEDITEDEAPVAEIVETIESALEATDDNEITDELTEEEENPEADA